MNAPNIAYVFVVPWLESVGKNRYLVSKSSMLYLGRLLSHFEQTVFVSVSRDEDKCAHAFFKQSTGKERRPTESLFLPEKDFPESLRKMRDSQMNTMPVVLAVTSLEAEQVFLSGYTQEDGRPFEMLRPGSIIRCDLETMKGELLS
jgi:hypothetical protein